MILVDFKDELAGQTEETKIGSSDEAENAPPAPIEKSKEILELEAIEAEIAKQKTLAEYRASIQVIFHFLLVFYLLIASDSHAILTVVVTKKSYSGRVCSCFCSPQGRRRRRGRFWNPSPSSEQEGSQGLG